MAQKIPSDIGVQPREVLNGPLWVQQPWTYVASAGSVGRRRPKRAMAPRKSFLLEFSRSLFKLFFVLVLCTMVNALAKKNLRNRPPLRSMKVQSSHRRRCQKRFRKIHASKKNTIICFSLRENGLASWPAKTALILQVGRSNHQGASHVRQYVV